MNFKQRRKNSTLAAVMGVVRAGRILTQRKAARTTRMVSVGIFEIGWGFIDMVRLLFGVWNDTSFWILSDRTYWISPPIPM